MSNRNIIDFLNTLAIRTDLLDDLKTKSKDTVIASAAELGFPFSEPEFDTLIWDLEAHLANKRGEPFNAQFSLWQTMWGKYYLEYLVTDLIPSFDEADFDAVMMTLARSR
jgi:hypothetical protein